MAAPLSRCPPEILLAIMTQDAIGATTLNSMLRISKRIHAVLTHNITTIIKAHALRYKPAVYETMPNHILSSGPARCQLHPNTLQWLQEIEYRARVNEMLLNHPILRLPHSRFPLFPNVLCLVCQDAKSTIIKQKFLDLLWQIADAGTCSFHNGVLARKNVLRHASVESLACLLFCSHSVSDSWRRFGGAIMENIHAWLLDDRVVRECAYRENMMTWGPSYIMSSLMEERHFNSAGFIAEHQPPSAEQNWVSKTIEEAVKYIHSWESGETSAGDGLEPTANPTGAGHRNCPGLRCFAMSVFCEKRQASTDFFWREVIEVCSNLAKGVAVPADFKKSE